MLKVYRSRTSRQKTSFGIRWCRESSKPTIGMKQAMTSLDNEQVRANSTSAAIEVVCSDAVSESAAHTHVIDWVVKTLRHADQPDASVSIKIVDLDEMVLLNTTFRQKNMPTNVLSFPFEAATNTQQFAEVEAEMEDFIGDIAICDAVVKTEAQAQGKTYEQHFAHLTVHGVLHLLGFDHVDESEAAEMENNEIAILAMMGFANPYETDLKDVKNDHE